MARRAIAPRNAGEAKRSGAAKQTVARPPVIANTSRPATAPELTTPEV